jgi:predicted  nucleic acid-binding Zn-ribbon protein
VESQSRYSIVERLAKMKLDIMDSRNNLDSEIIKLRQKLAMERRDLDHWEKTIKTEIERAKEEKARIIQITIDDIDNAEKKREQNIKHFNEKIKEIDAAMVAIQKISESAPSPQENN